jgi:hypothetical protein
LNYSNKTTKQLFNSLDRKFKKFIRLRDSFNGIELAGSCISCGKPVRGSKWHPGHFYPAGKVKSLRFDPDNCHGQCRDCNYFLHGNLLEYRKNLIRKIGEDRVLALDIKASIEKQKGFHKWERFDLIAKLQEL